LNIFFLISLFQKKNAGWTTENIDEVKYDSDKKLLTFSTSKLSPLAYIQVNINILTLIKKIQF